MDASPQGLPSCSQPQGCCSAFPGGSAPPGRPVRAPVPAHLGDGPIQLHQLQAAAAGAHQVGPAGCEGGVVVVVVRDVGMREAALSRHGGGWLTRCVLPCPARLARSCQAACTHGLSGQAAGRR